MDNRKEVAGLENKVIVLMGLWKSVEQMRQKSLKVQ